MQEAEESSQVVEDVVLEPADPAPSQPSGQPSHQATAEAPLSSDITKPVAGEIVQDGLVYRVLPDGESAAWVGWRAPSLEGDVAVPARVASGADSYAVTAMGEADAAEGVLEGSSASSVLLPASVESVADGAFSGCSSLARISVSPDSEFFASFDGMLFTKDHARLLSIPEGKEGVASLPDETVSVPALSHCAGLAVVEVGEGNAAFASRNGLLYSKDMKTLIGCPPGAGDAVVVPASVEAIADGAFAGCGVASITVLGDVREIASGAFEERARAEAVVALPGGEGYEARRAAWEAAGFARFVEPARPGDVSAPEAPGGEDGSDAEGGEGGPEDSGLAYEVLDDYTLAASWAGPEGPTGELAIPAAAEVGGVSYRVSAVADVGFAGCSGLTGVSLPAGLTHVGERAFEACGLADVWLPASVASVGSRALAACPSLARVVALGATDAAPDALAECSGVSVYCPAGSEASWNMGLPAAGNHLMPYGIALAEEPLRLEAGRSASLLDGGSLLAPEPVEASYSYAAKPLSVDADGVVAGKAEGSSEVAVSLTLDAVELARATRAVEVAEAAPAQTPGQLEEPASDSMLDEEIIQIDEELSLQPGDGEAEASPEPASLLLDDELFPISYATTLITDETISFTARAPTGQQLHYTVLPASEGEPAAVEVAMAPDTVAAGPLTIPAFVEHEGQVYAVTNVAANGFNLSAVTSLSFESDAEKGPQMKSIGEGGFSNCKMMESVVLPSTLQVLGDKAFICAFSLTAIEVPDSVVQLGQDAFTGCPVLCRVVLGSGISSLPSRALAECDELLELHVRGRIVDFDPSLFASSDVSNTLVYVVDTEEKARWEKASNENYYRLNSDNIVIASSGQAVEVTFAGNGGYPEETRVSAEVGSPVAMRTPVREGFGLEGFYTDASCAGEFRWGFDEPVSESMTLYANWVENVVDGDLVYRVLPDGSSLSVAAVDPAKLSGRLELEAAHEFGGRLLPVTEIANLAFHESSITSVAIPDSVEVIGSDAFSGCASLGAIDISDESRLTTLESDAFTSCTSLKELFIPKNVSNLLRAAFYKCSSLETVTFGEGTRIETIGNRAFAATGLTGIAFPDTVKTIGHWAFTSCSNLTSVELPEGLRSIESGAFRYVPLRSVYVPAGVEKIDDDAFFQCGYLASISLPAGLRFLGSNAFMNTYALGQIVAWGSMSQVKNEIMTGFTPQQKAKMTVVLPAVAQDGSGDSFQTMKTAWMGYGFAEANIIQSSGALPLFQDAANPCVANSDPALASWSLSDDGTLSVRSKEGVAVGDFGWVYTDTRKNTENWGPVRALVRSVDTTGLAGAPSMACWFREMPLLTDIAKFVIPENLDQPYVTTDVSDCFTASGIDEIPAEFKIPEGVTSVNALFNHVKITEIPDYFTLPSTLTNCNGLFMNCAIRAIPTALAEQLAAHTEISTMKATFLGCTELASLPEGFAIPRNVTDASQLFSGCTALVSLPEHFAIPEKVKDSSTMFSGCTSLASVPNDFVIPGNVTNAYRMFYNCPSLASLPTNFSISKTAAQANPGSMFGIVEGDGAVRVPLYYDGIDPVVKSYDWKANYRTLVQPDEHAGEVPVTLNVKVAGEEGEGSYWTTAYTDASGKLAEPDYAPSRTGMVFTLWYADAACTRRVDFSQPFAADATIYGKLAPGTRGGALPCEAGTGSAFWTLADDGTLYIRGAGTVNVKLPDTDNAGDAVAWVSVREKVERISMCPSLSALFMHNWFRGMVNLIDCTEAFVPEGVASMHRTFEGCTSLPGLPEGFTIPDSVTNIASAFKQCTALTTLPSSFCFSETSRIDNVSHAFRGCSTLASLPESFVLPPRVSASGAAYVFEGCRSLTALPAGFKIPDAAHDTSMFFCPIGENEPRVATYYAGDDPSVLSYDWASQNRTLVRTADDAADKGQYPVAYKLMNPETNVYETYASMLTNGDGMVRDMGMPQKNGYGFIGWFADEDCLEAFDFSQPATGETTLYAKWAKRGGKGTDAGTLPTEGADGVPGFEAWWGIATDGALHIVCENGSSVAPLGFKFDDAKDAYWEPFSKEVTAIRMEQDVKARDMVGWFKFMSALTDASKGFFIPQNCQYGSFMFYFCSSLQTLPRGMFEGVENLKTVGGMLQSCSNLKTLPDDFVLPTSVETAFCLFFQTGISALPENFTLHENLSQMKGMFYWCPNLTSLPEDMKIPSTATDINELFLNCPKLTSLPPHLLENVVKMPADGSFRQSLAKGWNVFGFNSVTSPNPDPLPTYFPATDEELSLVNWTVQKRAIVKADAPDRQYLASLKLPDDAGAYSSSWKTLYAGGNNVIATEPTAAPRRFQTFEGWYEDAACTKRVSFPLTLTGDVDLYARYETTGGALPTMRDGVEGEEASWTFNKATGTLTIRCDVPGAKIKHLFDMPADAHNGSTVGYWSNVKDRVEKVVMEPGIEVCSIDANSCGDMNYWFSEMSRLTDIRAVYVPSSAESVDHLFNRCTSLSDIPRSFDISGNENLTVVSSMFRNCSFSTLYEGFKLPPRVLDVTLMLGENGRLRSLPEGFQLPSSTVWAAYLFHGCYNLRSLPSSFELTENVDDVRNMFEGCKSLASLPAGFKIPSNIVKVQSMFNFCLALKALPDGFKFDDPSQIHNVSAMFSRCPALTSLPASLDLTGLSGAAGVDTMFGGLDDYTSGTPLTTYYAGSDLSKLSLDGTDAAAYWRATFGRELVATSGGQDTPADRCTVNFMVPDSTGNAGYTPWQSLVVERGSVLADPLLPPRYGVGFEGWFDAETGGSKVDFGTATVADGATMTLYARFTAPILKATAPASAKITVDASGSIVEAPLRLTSYTAAPVRVFEAVARPNADADKAVALAASALEKVGLVVKSPVGKSSLVVYLDGITTPVRNDGSFTIPLATGPANPGVLDCSVGVEGLQPQDVRFYGDGFATGLADVSFTFALAN